MKRLIILSAMAASAAAGPLGTTAAINGADARSYFERGVAMYADKNYNGCLDQMLQLRHLDPNAAEQQDALYYVAMATLYSGDDEALDLMNAFLMRFPESPRTQEVTTAIGDYYFTRGNYGDAIHTYLTVNPDALSLDRADDLRYRLAYSYMMLGENDNALRLFDQLADTKTYGNAARFYKAYIAYSRKDYTKARELFNQVDTNREPGQAALYYICQLDFLDGNYTKALSEARSLLAQNAVPEFAPELNRIAGESLYNLGQTADAIPYLKTYVATSDNVRPTAYYMLGVSEYETGNYTSAIPMLQMATGDADITGQSAYLYLGQAYVATGQTDAAMLAFEKASRMSFDDRITEAATYNYIAARRDGGRIPFGKTVETMESFLKRWPRSVYADNVREGLVGGYLTDNDYDNALRIINDIPRPSDKMLRAKQKALLMLGSRLYQNGETAKALEYFNEGAALRSSNSDVTRQCRLWAANCYFDLDNYEDSANGYLAYLQSAPATDPNRLQARYNLGYARLRQKNYADAFKDFTEVAANTQASRATRADALNRAADCLYCQRNFKEAANYYEQAYDTYPQAGDYALFQRAEMAGLSRDYNTRLNLLEQMLDKFPSSALAPDALLAKAETYNVMKRPAEAVTALRQVVESYPSTAQGRQASLTLAVTLLNNGNRDGAIETYRSVVENYPTSQEARVAIDDLKNIYAEEGRLPEYVMFVNSVPDAPKIEISQLESTAFETAEERYLSRQDASRLEDYIKQFPGGANTPKALLYLADEASQKGNQETAVAYASRIVTEYPDASEAEDALLIKADGEAALGKGELALTSYRQLAAKASTPEMLRDARTGIMQTAIDLNRYDDVLEATEQLLSSSAVNAEADQIRFTRAVALDRLGRHDEAYELWTPLSKDPSTLAGSKSAVYMIESLAATGNDSRAEKMANDFIDTGSPHNYWYARGFIAYSDILRRQGKTFEADEYLKALKSNYPDADPDIFDMIDSRLNQ